jgi:hypothetical protein
MARAHFWTHLINDNGEPIKYAEIYVYTAGSTSPAYVFLEEIGGLPYNNVPQTKSNSEGRIDFWIGDIAEDRGYSKDQKFKIYYVRGSESGTIDYITVLPISPQAVETTTTTWISAAPSGYWAELSHYLNNQTPLVQCWNLSTAEVEEPTQIETPNPNVVRVYFPLNIYKYVVTIVG